MSAADDAFAAAERMIDEARRTGATRLSIFDPKTHALGRIPDSIAGLTELRELSLGHNKVSDLTPISGLVGITALYLSNTSINDLSPISGMVRMTRLDLDNTQVSDLSPISGMVGMTRLDLSNTQVSDLSPISGLLGMTTLFLNGTQVSDLRLISGMVGMKGLWVGNLKVSDLGPISAMVGIKILYLSNTQVSDLSPISGMVGITKLYLDHTQVSDLRPINGMVGMTVLDLNDTQVNDLSPISGMVGMTRLDLSNTQVSDLSAVLSMPKLTSEPKTGGLRFNDTPFTRADARAAEIAAIEDPKDRAAALFEYLGGGREASDTFEATVTVTDPGPPPRQPAPIEIEVTETRIALAGRDGLPARDANERAAMGWEAIKDYRTDFERSYNLSNNQPLPGILSSLDRAMGDRYEPARTIRIGVQVQRLQALAADPEFTANLPVGSANDLKAMVSEQQVYLNRFPDWLAYRDDAAPVTAADVLAARQDFAEIRDILSGTPEATDELKKEYASEVAGGTGEKATDIDAKALVASTREIGREIAERKMAEQRLNRRMAKDGGAFIDSLRRPLGLPHHLAIKLERPLRRLANRGFSGFSWVNGWYDEKFGRPDERDDKPKQ